MYQVRKTLILSTSTNWSHPDPCNWDRVGCVDNRISRIQLGYQNVSGFLSPAIAKLANLSVLDLMNNSIKGLLPSLKGLNSLEILNVYNNQFDSLLPDFLDGLRLLSKVNLNNNPLDHWSIPRGFQTLVSLTEFSAISANIVGKIPHFFNARTFPSLSILRLSENGLWGTLPPSFGSLPLQTLLLNDQNISGGAQALTRTIEVLQNMTRLVQIRLQGNEFIGPIPDLSKSVALRELSLRDNRLSGPLPQSIIKMKLSRVSFVNNAFQGPTPKFGPNVSVDVTGENNFCLGEPGMDCDSRVDALISTMEPFEYPLNIAQGWKGNDPCIDFVGISCFGGNISVINLKNKGLSGTLSPNFASLTSVVTITLADNNITGTIPNELTTMPNLETLDLSNNPLDLSKIPAFSRTRVIVGNNVVISQAQATSKKHWKTGKLVSLIVGVGIFFVSGSVICFLTRTSIYGIFTSSCVSGNGASNGYSQETSGQSDIHGMEISELVKSLQALKTVTNNFSEDRILGKGGFGTVFLGELPDGTKIAVKRMKSRVLGDKDFAEFQSEINVLTTVRHRHVVDLLGFCVDGNEKILVYEYLSQGALSRHLLNWKDEGLKPLEWKQRLTISLDVARGVEYLHGFAQHSFIHRDLKPSNILMGDLRCLILDLLGLFLMVTSIPFKPIELEHLVYVAPEYAEMGRITIQVDVYSFGVILMQMITGRKALDESRSDDSVLLVHWFRKMSTNEGTFQQVIDPVIELDKETLASVTAISELARQCCVRDPRQRPDMVYVVKVILSLTNKWQPAEDNDSAGASGSGIDLSMTLPEALAKWQAHEDSIDYNSSSLSEIVPQAP